MDDATLRGHGKRMGPPKHWLMLHLPQVKMMLSLAMRRPSPKKVKKEDLQGGEARKAPRPTSRRSSLTKSFRMPGVESSHEKTKSKKVKKEDQQGG